ncbi:hypothetical protein H632_c1694p1 [Helicosporidium sp. ATCC 50920]|nr:hypothetical protein H632_c1694p1 [Helicosporidium sp. ATCC 50920]|eukprot:KDD73962.1 hypothetical protein H632_c1694p1 [Helicosporidium sp. ATCC 50920]
MDACEPLECHRCHKNGMGKWKNISRSNMKDWTRYHGKTMCASCKTAAKEDHREFVRQRKYFARLKERIYPRSGNSLTQMRAIVSGVEWLNTRSFIQGLSSQPQESLPYLGSPKAGMSTTSAWDRNDSLAIMKQQNLMQGAAAPPERSPLGPGLKINVPLNVGKDQVAPKSPFDPGSPHDLSKHQMPTSPLGQLDAIEE